MKRKLGKLLGGRYFFDTFDPSGSYTGSYVGFDDEEDEPEQDADDL